MLEFLWSREHGRSRRPSLLVGFQWPRNRRACYRRLNPFMLSKKSGCYLEFWTRISVAFSSSLLARSHGDEPSPSTALCTELVFMADGHNHPTTDHREAESGLISNMTRKSWLTLDHSHSSNPAGLAFAKAFTALYDTFLQPPS